MTDTPQLVVAVHRVRRRAVIEATGEIDAATGPVLTNAAEEVLRAGALEVWVDLGPTAFMDSTGLNVLLRLRRRPAGALLTLAACAGTGIGAAVALTLWMFGPTDTGWLAQTVLGALAGAVAGVVTAAVVVGLRRRHAGLAETGHGEPRQYDILVEEDYAEAARAVLEAR